MKLSTLFRDMMRSFALIFLLQFTIHAYSQEPTTRAQRTVVGKKFFKCTFSHEPKDQKWDTVLFKNEEEGCRHWAEIHLPAGYNFQTVGGTNEIGAVTCICKKGNQVNDQGGIIRGIIICPELATEINDGTPFPNLHCECPDKLSAPYYIASGNRCILDCGVQQQDEREQVPGAKNVFKGTPEERKVAGDRIREYRTKNGPKEKGSFGYAEGEIGGKPFPGDIVGSGPPDPNDPKIFEAASVNPAQVVGGDKGWLRTTDSEYKSLTKVAQEMGATKGQQYCDTQGTLKIVSERPYCPSCLNVIRQFNEMYPNVKLILIDGIK